MTHPGVIAKRRVDVHTSILRELHAMSTNLDDTGGHRPMSRQPCGAILALGADRQKMRFCRYLADVNGDFAENGSLLGGARKGWLMPGMT
jgi:hypothetical protein